MSTMRERVAREAARSIAEAHDQPKTFADRRLEKIEGHLKVIVNWLTVFGVAFLIGVFLAVAFLVVGFR